MPVISLPWPYVPNVGPSYSADDWANVWAWLARDGRTPGHLGVLGGRDSLRVRQSTFPQLTVQSGAALVGGRFVQSTADETLSVGQPDPTYKRIDLVVIRTNANDKTGEIVVKAGLPDPAPTAPLPVQTGAPYFELPLCEVHVRPGATSWTAQDFQDVRRFVDAPGDLILDVYKETTVVPAATPVFLDTVIPSNRQVELRGTITPSTSLLDRPLLGVALEARLSTQPFVPVLARGLTVLRPTQAVNAGDHLGVFLKQDLSGWLILPAWRYYNDNPPVYPRHRLLGTALHSAGAGEQCLVWVDPLTYWATPRTWSVTRLADSDWSTTSTTWTVLTIPTLQVNVRTRLVEIALAGAVRHSAAGGECHLGLAIDGTPLPGVGGQRELLFHQLSAANQNQQVAVTQVVDWVEACRALSLNPYGTHTVDLAVRTNTGTLTLYGATGAAARWQLRVREVYEP